MLEKLRDPDCDSATVKAALWIDICRQYGITRLEDCTRFFDVTASLRATSANREELKAALREYLQQARH